MVTKQPDYDTKPEFGTILDKHRRLPFKRFMDVIQAKFADLNDILNQPAAADQHPGNIIPHAVPVLFGPLSLTTARRSIEAQGGAGHELLATLANPALPVTPRNGNMLVGRELSFQVQSLSVYGFVNWGYSADPGFTVTPPFGPVGDIFDPVLLENGGAMPLDFFGATFSTNTTVAPNMMNISADVELYDRLRARRIHDGRLPIEMFQGGRIAHRKMASPIMFEKGSNIEPRLFINEIRMGSALDATATFNLARVKVWVCILFKGRQFIEVPNV